MNSLALLYAFAEKFVDSQYMDNIKEVFRMMELGKRLKEEGIKEGDKQRLIRTSIRLLTKKFGILSEELKNKIQKLDTETLEIIVNEILDFEKLEDVSKYLQ